MITFKEYQLKNSLHEFTIEEYEKVTEILSNEELVNIEKYIDILLCLGLPENVLDEMTDDEFFNIINSFTFSIKSGMAPSIEIEGYEYVAYTEDTFKLKVKDLSLIEKAIVDTPNNYLSRAMAVIFKRADLTRVEHYSEAHLKEKTKLFKKVSAAIAFPYLIHLTEKLNSKLNAEVSSRME